MKQAVGDYTVHRPTLFDHAAAQDAKAQGIDQGIKGIDPFWEAQVLLRVRPYLRAERRFNPDQFRQWAEAEGALTPWHFNHWGALLNKHEGRLWRRTNERYISDNTKGHGNAVFWRESLIFGQRNLS